MTNNEDRLAYMSRMAEAAERTFWGYLGCRIEELNDRTVTISLEAESHHLNLIGIVHGGVLSSLLDNAMGLAVLAARPEEKTVTTNLNVNFVAPLHVGKLLVEAQIVHQSCKMITVSGRILGGEGNLGTIGTGTFRVID